MLEVLDAAAVRRWYRWGLLALDAARPEIDSLNVFPVADADTGTNLYLTLWSAVEAADDRQASGASLAETATTMARLCLLGARGSSGVILSELLRGVAEVFAAQRRPPAGLTLTAALERAVELAYSAVARPVEGTMLSVARAAAQAARGRDSDDLGVVVAAAATAAADALARTPTQLPVLARAGVVDAGGRGIVVLLDVLRLVVEQAELVLPQPIVATPDLAGCLSTDADSPAFEVMYLIDTADDRVPALRAALDEIGEAVVISGGDGLWNVHVHTDDATAALELGADAGRPHGVRVTRIAAGGPPQPGRLVVMVFAAGSAGLAIAPLLTGVGGQVIKTGPAIAAEMLELGADELIVLTIDGALIPRADQEIVEAAVERTAWVAVDAPVQAVAAIAVHDAQRPFADDVAEMTVAARHTRHAVIGPADADELCAESVREMERLLVAGGELVTVLSVADVGSAIADAVANRRPDVDVNAVTVEALGSVVWLGVE